MRKFIFKLSIIIVILFVRLFPGYYFDTFNVFHWKNFRETSAEPNYNFIKTNYILQNKDKYNAFLFGSSRVGNYPMDLLPKEINGENLNWYNFQMSVGIPYENYLTLKTFIDNGVDVKYVILAFDDIAMVMSYENHKNDLMRRSWQEYQKNKFGFYLDYLKAPISLSIVKEVLNYDESKESFKKNNIYTVGNLLKEEYMERPAFANEYFTSGNVEILPHEYSEKNAYKDILLFNNLCKEHNIRVINIANPIYSGLYETQVKEGYLDFLQTVSENVEFYNFSGLNNFTLDDRYYYEFSHFIPALGFKCEQVIFGSEEEKLKVQTEAARNQEEIGLFGTLVNKENSLEYFRRLRAVKKFVESN